MKILVIGVIVKGNKILMRKKPDGSPPYKQTWYLFGGELNSDITPQEAIKKQVKKQANIDINFIKSLDWDIEEKKDIDEIKKYFVYLNCLCNYCSGELLPSSDIEKLEWIKTGDLIKYDIVPPAKGLLKRLGYLK